MLAGIECNCAAYSKIKIAADLATTYRQPPHANHQQLLRNIDSNVLERARPTAFSCVVRRK